MKFALVNGQRKEAQPNLSGECPRCGSPTVAKCGEVRVWHWAHKGRLSCDPWWENETQWHRDWKNQFPTAWQEIVQTAEDGERHIADVKTDRGWVIEFQHSYLTPEERRSRDTFYRRLIWVVNGTRRKRDEDQFVEARKEGRSVGAFRRAFSDTCPLLREWAGTSAPIFLDFGGDVLWWLFAPSTNGSTYVAPYPRAQFIESHRGGATHVAQTFDKLVNDIPTMAKLIADYERLRAQPLRDPLQPRRPRRPFRF